MFRRTLLLLILFSLLGCVTKEPNQPQPTATPVPTPTPTLYDTPFNQLPPGEFKPDWMEEEK